MKRLLTNFDNTQYPLYYCCVDAYNKKYGKILSIEDDAYDINHNLLPNCKSLYCTKGINKFIKEGYYDLSHFWSMFNIIRYTLENI